MYKKILFITGVSIFAINVEAAAGAIRARAAAATEATSLAADAQTAAGDARTAAGARDVAAATNARDRAREKLDRIQGLHARHQNVGPQLATAQAAYDAAEKALRVINGVRSRAAGTLGAGRRALLARRHGVGVGAPAAGTPSPDLRDMTGGGRPASARSDSTGSGHSDYTPNSMDGAGSDGAVLDRLSAGSLSTVSSPRADVRSPDLLSFGPVEGSVRADTPPARRGGLATPPPQIPSIVPLRAPPLGSGAKSAFKARRAAQPRSNALDDGRSPLPPAGPELPVPAPAAPRTASDLNPRPRRLPRPPAELSSIQEETTADLLSTRSSAASSALAAPAEGGAASASPPPRPAASSGVDASRLTRDQREAQLMRIGTPEDATRAILAREYPETPAAAAARPAGLLAAIGTTRLRHTAPSAAGAASSAVDAPVPEGQSRPAVLLDGIKQGRANLRPVPAAAGGASSSTVDSTLRAALLRRAKVVGSSPSTPAVGGLSTANPSTTAVGGLSTSNSLMLRVAEQRQKRRAAARASGEDVSDSDSES